MGPSFFGTPRYDISGSRPRSWRSGKRKKDIWCENGAGPPPGGKTRTDVVGSRMDPESQNLLAFLQMHMCNAEVQTSFAPKVCRFFGSLLLSKTCRQRFLEDQRWLAQASRIGGRKSSSLGGYHRGLLTWKSQSLAGVIQIEWAQ